MRLRLALAIVAWATAWPAAQGPLLVAVDEGDRVRPVARFDGSRWAATCDVPPRRGSATKGRSPRAVASEGLAVEPIRHVPIGGAEWRQLEPRIKQLFDERAKRENVTAAALASVPLRIEAIVTPVRVAPSQTYFFVSSRTIPDSRADVDMDADGEVDPKGELRVDVSGWLGRVDAAVTSIGTSSTLSWEQVDDRPAGATARRSDLTPIAIVRAGASRAWLMQGRAGAARWYVMYQVGDAGVRLLVRTDSRGC
jgi:hypothetical protein